MSSHNRRLLGVVESISKWIAQEVLVDFPNGKSILTDDPIDELSLYSGISGLAYFEADALQATHNNAHEDRAEKYLQLVKDSLPSKTACTGLFVGIGGLAWSQIRYAEVTKHDTGIDSSLRLIAASRRFSKEDCPLDVVFGSAGRGLIFLRGYMWKKDAWYLEQASEEAHILLSHRTADGFWLSTVDAEPETLWGFSHGMAGILYFLYELGSVSDDPALIRLVKEKIRFLLKLAQRRGKKSIFWPTGSASAEPNPSWCHGTAGIGLLISKLHGVTDDYRTLLQTVRRSAVEASVGANSYGLCHGLAGVGTLSIEIDEVLMETDRSDTSKLIRAVLLDKDDDTDSYPTWSKAAPRWRKSLMLGDSGVGHLFCRCVNPKIPHFALLP